MNTFICPTCGKTWTENPPKFCPNCGCSSEKFQNADMQDMDVQPIQDNQKENEESQQNSKPIIINQIQEPPHNSVGTAGFVIALIAVFLSWVPVLGWILWVIGAFLSLIGMFKNPKGLAIAGFVLSFIGLLILILVGGMLATLLLI